MAEPCTPDYVVGKTRESVWNDLKLCVYEWRPTGNVVALVYLTHGFAEYVGRHEELCQLLSENGFLVFGHDHVGHGRSEGVRAYIEDFNTYVLDVINHVRDMKSSYPGIPCFLMGHSMGGLIALLAAIQYQDMFSGFIFSAAGMETNLNPFPTFIASLIGLLAPWLGVASINPSFISTLPEEVEIYINDPLIYHGKMTAKLLSENLTKGIIARVGLNIINLPALLLHGTEDHLVPLSSSDDIFNNISSEDKEYEKFDGSYHEVLHDKEQERALNVIKDWLVAHKD